MTGVAGVGPVATATAMTFELLTESSATLGCAGVRLSMVISAMNTPEIHTMFDCFNVRFSRACPEMKDAAANKAIKTGMGYGDNPIQLVNKVPQMLKMAITARKPKKLTF